MNNSDNSEVRYDSSTAMGLLLRWTGCNAMIEQIYEGPCLVTVHTQ